jgi:hypothetical protein
MKLGQKRFNVLLVCGKKDTKNEQIRVGALIYVLLGQFFVVLVVVQTKVTP